MSDIFEINQQRQAEEKNFARQSFLQKAKSDTPNYEAKAEAARQELQANIDRYAVTLAPEEYEILNNAISNADIPEDEAYRWASALEMSKQFGIEISDAYKNLEEYSAAIWGKERTFVPKTNFKAIVDYGNIGVNTVKLGKLGNQLMMAEIAGNEEKVKDVLAQIEAIDAENESLADNQDRRWYIEALKMGAQSAPFTGYVATAGLIGGLVSGGLGTGLAFAASMELAQGMEYVDLRKEGATKENALAMSVFSGSLQALVETAMGNVAGVLGKNAVGAGTKKAITEKVTGNLFKRLHYDKTFATLAVKMGSEYLKENFEEGMEEVIQDLISKGTHALAAELEEYDIEPMTAESVAKDAWENFRGGILGSLVLGVGSTAINTSATIKDYSAVKEAASSIPSDEAYEKIVSESPVFKGMETEERTELIKKIREDNRGKLDESIQKQTEDIAEAVSYDENMERFTSEIDEDGNEIPGTRQEVGEAARDEDGNLYHEISEPHENKDGTYSSEMVFGDPSKETQNQYGKINVTVDEDNNTVTIDNFQTSETRQDLRNEMYADMAKYFEGYDIKWDPKSEGLKAIKEQLIGLNPQGPDAGLNYYGGKNQGKNAEARIKLAQELRANLNNAKVSNEMIAPLVAEFEALGNTFGFEVADFYNKTFGGKVFGNAEVAKAEALAQGKGKIRGGISIDDSAKTVQGLRAVIYAAENADFSTFSHELAHLGRRMAEVQNGALSEEINKAFGIDENGWTREKEELFAEAFEDYLHSGEAKTPGLKELFQKLAEFLVRTYHQLHDKITLSDDMKNVYDQLLKGDADVLRNAEEAVKNGLSEPTSNVAQSENVASQETTETTENLTKSGENLTENDEALSDEEIKTLVSDFTNDELQVLIDAGLITEETAQAVQETKLDDVTQAAVASILDDPTIPQEKKVEAVMKANGESYRIKQENIERYQARTDLNAEEKKAAIDDILNNRTTDRNGGGQAFSTLESGKDMLFQIIGKKGAQALDEANEETYRMDNQRIAEDMEKAGKDARTIRMATGWERGADGEWKYEISDIKIKSNPIYQTDEGDYKLAKLGDVIEAEELFEAYPQLKDTVLQIQNLPLGVEGHYTKEDDLFPNGIITISSSNLRKENPEFTRLYEEFKNTDPGWKEYERKEAQYDNNEISASDFLEWEEKEWEKSEGYKYLNELLMGRIVPRMVDGLSGESTIAHEIQHAIQHFEGFATGGSPESLTAKAYNSLIDDLVPIYAEIGSDEILQSKIKAYKKANLELNFSRDDILDQMREAEAIKDNDAKLTELWDKLQDISKKYNFVNNAEIEPLFDFRITDIESSNAKEALGRAKRLISERSKEDYHNLAGEVESRNVQDRLGLTVEERRRQLLEDTEDVTRKDQIVTFDNPTESKMAITAPAVFQGKTFEDAKKIYPNIIDVSELFNEHPTVNDLKEYLKNTVGKETVTFDKSAKVVIPQKSDKRKHIVNSSRYNFLNKPKNADSKERHEAYVISADELISNSTFDRVEPNKKVAKKPDVLNYYHFNVPVFIDGHGWNVDVVAEETKKSGAARPQNNTAASTQATTQQNNNVTLSNIQVNLYDFVETNMLFQDEKTLAGIHNLSEENLQHVFKMGGLANPSMAVIDTASSDFTNFGDISLVAPKSLIAKTTGNNAGTFGADIYSPRYPSINIGVTDKGNAIIKEIIKDIEDDTFRQTVKERIRQAMEDNRPYNANRAFAVPFLLEKGDKSFYVIPEMDLDADEFELYNKAVAADVYSPIDMTDEMKKDFTEMYLNKEIEKHKEKYPDWDQKDIDYLNESLRDEDTGYLNSRLFFNYWDHLRTTVRKAGQVDEYKTLDNAKNLVESEKYRDEFDAYKKEKIASIDKKERIFNGYTPSGNRRWLDHTLENVSKFMKQQATRGGESFSYGMGSTRARVAPKWTTLEQIAKNKNRLVSKDEFETVKAELESTYDELTDIISDGNGFDAGEARLNEALESVNPLSYLKREYDIDFSDDEKEMFTSFIEALKKMPTEYFETKFNRPVYMNEFYGAVIPRQTSQEVKDKLQEAGLTIKEYDDPDTRMQLIRQMGEAANGEILFQENIDQAILNEAAQFENWMDYRDFMEATNMGTEGVPVDASADWYLNTWEIAHNVSPTTAERNAAEMQEKKEQRDEARRDPVMVDAEWYTMIQKPGNLEAFLKLVYQATHIDAQEMASLNEEEAAYVQDIINRTERMFHHGVYSGNITRVHNGKELTNKARETMLTLMGQRKRDYRAIYADITGQSEYLVEKTDLQKENANIAKDALRYKLISYASEVDAMSPEEKTKLLNQIKDESIREKFKKDNVKMLDPDVEHYISMLESDIKTRNKELAAMRTDFNEDVERMASKQERDIIRQYEQYLNAKSEADFRKIPLPAGSKNAERIGEKYKRQVQSGMKHSFTGMVQDWDTLKTEIEANVKAQERLRAENRISELEEKIRAEYDAKRVKTLMSKAERLNAMAKEYTQKQQEVAAAKKLREMRKALVKRVMRRVNFNTIDYNRAKQIIAVQKVFDPNLRGGINKWIGTENKLAREVWSAWNTDFEAKENMLKRLSNRGKLDVIRLLEQTKTEEDFEKLTKKEQKMIERAMPRQDWIKELKLDIWKDERDNALQLPIKEITETQYVTQADGTKKPVEVTRVEFPSEIEELLVQSIGQDMTYAIQYRHFEDWTTGDMEELARRMDKMFKEGRDMLAARREAERIQADRIRERIREAINNTGIVINEDDPEDVKKKKQAKIDKILGVNQQLPGSTGSKKEKQQTFIDRLLHSYHDANIRRVARMLDNFSEGELTNLLYWQENDCFNREERAKSRRNAKIDEAIQNNKLDMRKLGKVIEFNGTKYTWDDVLMVWAAKMNQDDYYAEQLKDNPDLKEEYALEESAYKAIKYGNMILDTERENFRKIDEKILEAEKERKEKLHAAELAGDEEAVKLYSQIPSDIVDANGNLELKGTVALKALAESRIKGLLAASAEVYKEFEPLIDAIRKDYSEEFDHINEVSIREFNAPVWREKWYLPLIRLTAAGDTHEQRLKQDLLGHSAGTGKAGTEKGFTKKRVEIGPMNQAPVELGLYSTWADSVERNEHFIAYAGYVRELNRVLFSKDAVGTMQEIENRYGKAMKDYLDVYVKEIANPNIEEPKKGLDRVMHAMRGNTAPAYLGWKFSSVLKQGIESPAPFMQFINPAEYMHGAIQLATKKWTRDSIGEKSAFMKSRVFDPIADLINENVEKSFSKPSYYLKKFEQKGMEGLEWIDWACVAPGWIAIYEKEYARLQETEQARFEARIEELIEQNDARFGQYRMTEQQIKQQAHDDVTRDIETEAVNKADDCVRLCQPSNRKVDLAPMFKNNSEAAKAVLQFQTALNVIWQNIRYDIPYAVKNKQYMNIVGMVLGYVMAGVISGMVTEGLLKDDDEPEDVAQRLGYYATTQFVDSIPIVGGNLDALAKKAITGEKSGLYNSSLWPTFDKYYNAASSFISEDYDKALKNLEQGLLLTTGLPLSGIKEVEAALGINDGEEGLNFNPEAFLGRR